MEKRLIAALAVIVFIVIYIGPFILAAIVIMGICSACLAVFNKYPYIVSYILYYAITPLLICGWLYYGYSIYKNNYCNTYEIRFSANYNLDKPQKYFEINTPSEEEAYIKAWEFFKNNYVKELKTKNEIWFYGGALQIWNQSKNRYCHPLEKENLDSLIKVKRMYYRTDTSLFDFKSLIYNQSF